MNNIRRTARRFGIVLGISMLGFGGQGVHVVHASSGPDWAYPVDAPTPPQISKRVRLTSPTVAEIQNALTANTSVEVHGNVQFRSGDTIAVRANDVQLDFQNADKITWTGQDTWAGFIEIYSSRVELIGLDLEVASNSPGNCRGVQLYTPASDVRITGCRIRNTADGIVADGEWERLAIEDTDILDISDWTNPNWDGGYGIFLEDDDLEPDHLWIDNISITLSSRAGQHGLRMSQVQHALIENSTIGANNKRTLWAYGVYKVCVRNCVFEKGSVLFNLRPSEWYTERPLEYLRVDNCTINHNSIMTPLAIHCGKGTRYVQMRHIDIYSPAARYPIEIGWREPFRDDNGKPFSQLITWPRGTIWFNDQPADDRSTWQITDWTEEELDALRIGPQ